MKLFRFDPEVGRSIDQYKSSNFVISKVAQLLGEAVIPQLFLVVQGEGWVRGESPDKIPIQMGQVAYWEEGEWHEAGAETGLTAVIIEGTNFDPAHFMQMIYR